MSQEQIPSNNDGPDAKIPQDPSEDTSFQVLDLMYGIGSRTGDRLKRIVDLGRVLPDAKIAQNCFRELRTLEEQIDRGEAPSQLQQ